VIQHTIEGFLCPMTKYDAALRDI